MTPEEFAPPNLELAASMIRDYGDRNRLTPRQLLDVFNEGLAAIASSPNPPEWLMRTAIYVERADKPGLWPAE